MTTPPPLWTCPTCRRRFVTRNMWHSCEVYTVEQHLARVPESVGRLYLEFEALAQRCGPFEVVPTKSRIAWMVRMRFGGAVLQQRAVRGALLLPAVVDDDPRVIKVESYSPHSHGHHLRLRTPADLDDRLAEWTCQAYRLGEQRDLYS